MWTQEEIKIIRENHGKKTLKQIMEILPGKHSYYAMRSFCQRLGLYRDKTIVRIPWKNRHNEEYWKEPNLINTYLAGFIAADGCVSVDDSGGCRFVLKLSIKDEIMIDLFKNELNWCGKTSYCFSKSPHSENITKFCYIQMTCFHKNAAYLKQHYNLTPNKTIRLGPTNLSSKILIFIL